MLGKITNSLLRPFGVKIVRVAANHSQYPLDYLQHEIAIRQNTMLPRSVLHSLYDQVIYCEKFDIPGDFVECGVWRGGAVGLMARLNLEHGSSRRRLHLFDSFEEICQPDEKIDGVRAIRESSPFAGGSTLNGRLIPLTGIYDRFGGPGSLEITKKLLEQEIGYPKDLINYHKGWFQDTIPKDAEDIREIAILRLDGDWYASTKVCLDYLLDKVVPGGIVIIDDYNAYDGCRKAVDECLVSRQLKRYLHPINEESRYFVM